MNGKELTKKQILKIERIDKLFADLKKEGVEPLIYEGGGNPTLTFWRHANLDIDVLYQHNNTYYRANTKIDMWVP